MDAKKNALSLAQAGIPVYQLAPGSKTPPKGHHGYLEATTDTAIIATWPDDCNVGISLYGAGMVVIDLDRQTTSKEGKTVHREKNGLKALTDYLKEKKIQFPQNCYAEMTPNGGAHIFIKLDHQLKQAIRKTGALPGVDILGDFVIVAPSVINELPYQAMENKKEPITISTTATAPQWVLDLLNKQQPLLRNKSAYLSNGYKGWTERLFDKIVQGAKEGERNTWLTSIAGSLLYAGTEPENAYQLLDAINREFCTPPLGDREVNSIFKSILKRR